MALAAQRGRPPIYVSHGTLDAILPIDLTSRRLVPQLQSAGYDVMYEEFLGPHELRAEQADHAFAWFLGLPDPDV
jgi:phospholipase/carboxylesterase